MKTNSKSFKETFNHAEPYEMSTVFTEAFDLDTWDISGAVVAQEHLYPIAAGQFEAIFFKPDGTKLYIADYSHGDVYEYNLTTPWDISTDVYVAGFDVSAEDGCPLSMVLSTDGSKMYMAGINTGDKIFEYNLGTNWDITTAVYSTHALTTPATSFVMGIFFSPDGKNLIISGDFIGGAPRELTQYNLVSAWDITSAVYVTTVSVGVVWSPNSVYFNTDGTRMFLSMEDYAGNHEVWQYDVGTAYDISTIVYSDKVVTTPIRTRSLAFNTDGTAMYTLKTILADQYLVEYTL